MAWLIWWCNRTWFEAWLRISAYSPVQLVMWLIHDHAHCVGEWAKIHNRIRLHYQTNQAFQCFLRTLKNMGRHLISPLVIYECPHCSLVVAYIFDIGIFHSSILYWPWNAMYGAFAQQVCRCVYWVLIPLLHTSTCMFFNWHRPQTKKNSSC